MDTPSALSDWQHLSKRCEELRGISQFRLPSTDDPTRLVVNLSGLDPDQIKQRMEACRLIPELLDTQSAIFIPSPFNSEEDFSRLKTFVRSIGELKGEPEAAAVPPIPPSLLSLREALLSPKESVPIERAVGRICAEVVSVCPPATVLLAPGEKIGTNLLQLFHSYGILSVNVII